MKKIQSLFIICFFFMLVLATSADSAEKKICRHCSEEITKTFIKVNGFFFHPSHFICERCNSTIKGKSYYFENNNFYDDSCYQIISRIECAYCNKTIKGRYTAYDNKNYHKKCYQIVTAFPCAHCNGNITNSYMTYDNKNYHDSCYSKYIALRCSLCLNEINDKYTTDRYNNLYHSSHKNDSKSCNYCGGYFNNRFQKKGIIYDDGRGICASCNVDAIHNESEIEPLLIEVNEKLKPYNLDIPLHKVSVHLVDKVELDKLVQNKIKNPQGFTTFYQEKNILGMTLNRIINVYLLTGVPRISMINIIAHEFNHVWQGLQNDDEVDSDFCEGSCNYVSYLVLQQYPDDEAFYLQERLFADPDPDYGEGFRRVDRLVKEQGFSKWVNHLKKHKSFPNGY